MAFPDRFRDRLALTEAAFFGAAGAIAALWWPWPWLAMMVGPLIAVVVLIIATRQKREPTKPEPAKARFDIEERVRGWAKNVRGDAARTDADEAVELASSIAILNLRCERSIAAIEDDSARAAAERELQTIIGYIEMRMHTPERASDWDALAKTLRTGRDEFQDELDKLRQKT